MVRPPSKLPRLTAATLVCLAALGSPSTAAPAPGFGLAGGLPAAPGQGGERALGLGDARLDAGPLLLPLPEGTPPDGTPAPDGAAPAPAPPKLFDRKTTLMSAGLLAVTPVLSYVAWWRNDSSSTFTWNPEGWFGRDTYAGGADKASHVVFAWMAQDLLQRGYGALGKTPRQSRLLALGMANAMGILVEVGDGFSKYGFAWEDLVANAVGSAAGAAVDALGWRDTVGVRFGIVNAEIPPPCCRYGGYGTDYSREIFTLDLKLAGFLPRVGVKKPGLARFFLATVSYNTKGYRYSDVDYRQRNLGLEIGLNLGEVARALGVKDRSWWGGPLLFFLDYFRVPYTSFGMYYDFNHHEWHGPDTGDQFDPGLIIYD